MEPETKPQLPEARQAGAATGATLAPKPIYAVPDPWLGRALHWAFIGNHGLRAGWSAVFFILLYRLFSLILGTASVEIYPPLGLPAFSPRIAIIGELISVLAILGAGALVARLEHRQILGYNLAGHRRVPNLMAGMGAGFAGLSVLVGTLAWGGWLRFGPVALSGSRILRFAALWALFFLLVGLFEEGIFRCFLQFTFTRGINFWWALGIVGVTCLDLLLRSRGNVGIIAFIWLGPLPSIKGNGIWGVCVFALLGLLPCLVLHLKKIAGQGFWQAAWVTSTLFGFIHTGNNGENWIGIFAAGAIGFVFCVSIRVTGSAWWAIGCHASWDWAETYFYGTADSGLPAQGHYLTTSPVGAAFWSGGADGPEGSLLVLPVILLLLAALLVIYGRRKPGVVAAQIEDSVPV